MEITKTSEGGVTVFSLQGRVDANNAERAEKEILGAIDAGARRVVVDCEGLEYISSGGLRVLLMAAKRLAGGDGKLALASMRKPVREVFDIAGFSAVFDIHPTRASAIDAARSPGRG